MKKCKYCSKEFYPNNFNDTRVFCYECVPIGDKPARNRIRSRIKHLEDMANKPKIKKEKFVYRKVIEKIKGLHGSKCTICGYDKCISALEFHHKNPDQKSCSISECTSEKRMIDESKKCVLLCANCHREVHFYGYEFN